MLFLDLIALGWPSNPERDFLMQPITDTEMLSAIRSFPNNPGPGGVPLKVCKTYATSLTLNLAAIYNKCLEGDSPPSSMHEVHIIIIHNHPKDPSLCSPYRPIALLNCDFKIVTNIFSTRLI